LGWKNAADFDTLRTFNIEVESGWGKLSACHFIIGRAAAAFRTDGTQLVIAMEGD